MLRRPRNTILLVLAAASCQIAAAPAPIDPLSTRISLIRDRFVTAVRRCGITPRFVPTIAVLSTPSVIAYDDTQRTIFVGRWETLPPPIQSFFERWAAKDFPGQPPHRLYDQLFNDFLVGHELGHWLADQSIRSLGLDHYDAEIMANRFAIAFSNLRHPMKTGRIVGRFSYLTTLPNPVPPGEDERTWFNTHYESLGRTNPLAYNWYQGRFMAQAWKLRHTGNFCALVKASTDDS
ncbi:hypothetical protein QP166_11075 [Sphingomonas sp. LR60]|uniref:ImmA/IrrE family metallo-endopeptidase n=1 Tax=Sphingomonas sp. LR60 TaxID=3050233 RepID=UPI002FE1990A